MPAGAAMQETAHLVAGTGRLKSCNRHPLMLEPVIIFATTGVWFCWNHRKFVSLLLLIFWFAGTSLNFCWNHILFLREPTHVFATTHSPQICYHDDFLLEPANHFATTVLGFVTIVCFVIFCYIHLHDIACFSSQFCYNHALILLETKTIFATIIF